MAKLHQNIKPVSNNPKDFSQNLEKVFIKEAWHIVKLFWQSTQKKWAWGLVILIVPFSFFLAVLDGVSSYWTRHMYNALQSYDLRGFKALLGWFAILACAIIIVFVAQHALVRLLKMKWRRALSLHLANQWLSHHRYYLLQLTDKQTDNPDQRLAEDLENIVDLTTSIALGFLKSLLTLGVFVSILWQLSKSIPLYLGSWHIQFPGHLVSIAFLYAVWGTWMSQRTTRTLTPLYAKAEKAEGTLRYALARIREYSESIAFHQGHTAEKEHTRNLFDNITAINFAIIKKMLGVNLWLSFYGQIAILIPFLLVAPYYFKTKVGIGIFMQVAQSFGSVQNALSFFVNTYPELMALKTSFLRVIHLRHTLTQLSQTPASFARTLSPSSDLSFNHLHLYTPKGQEILSLSHQTISQGEWVWLRGPSGCGKSTLLRTLAGLWPFAKGSLSLPFLNAIHPTEKPPGGTEANNPTPATMVFFIPQKPYIPLGTLREALAYPASSQIFSDHTLHETLKACALAHLAPKLDETAFWPQVLSGGEQQRLAFARLLLAKPSWAFLDEATSALDPKTEKKLLTALKKRLPHLTLVTVGHNDSLKAFHHRVWSLEPGKKNS